MVNISMDFNLPSTVNEYVFNLCKIARTISFIMMMIMMMMMIIIIIITIIIIIELPPSRMTIGRRHSFDSAYINRRSARKRDRSSWDK